jgi:hypothetical protein
MKDLLLEDTYELVQAKQFLLSMGLNSDEINNLISEGTIWDTVKKVSKTAGRVAAIGAATASMVGDLQAHDGKKIRKSQKDHIGNSVVNPSPRIFSAPVMWDGSPQTEPGSKEDIFKKKEFEATLDRLIDDFMRMNFNNKVSDAAETAVKKAIKIGVSHRDSRSLDIATEILTQTARELKSDCSDVNHTYKIAREITKRLSLTSRTINVISR